MSVFQDHLKVAFLIALQSLSLAACVPTVRRARLQTSDPIGTTYWGEEHNGLLAGIAVKGPGGGEGEKAAVFGQAPGVYVSCKLKNVGDTKLRLVSPAFGRGLNGAEVSRVSPKSRWPWPTTEWAPDPQEWIVELAPGEELVESWQHRPELSRRTPYTANLRFEYFNYSSAASFMDGAQLTTVDELWIGRVHSRILTVTVK